MPRIVYDSDHGRLCPRCRKSSKACTCGVRQPTGDGIIRLRREKRRGKTVTVAQGFVDLPGLKILAKELKRRLGTGGTVTDDSLELQGDYLEQVAQHLREKGLTVKGS